MENKKTKPDLKVTIPNMTKEDLQCQIKNYLLHYTLKLIHNVEMETIPIEDPRYLLAFISNWVEDNIHIRDDDFDYENGKTI